MKKADSKFMVGSFEFHRLAWTAKGNRIEFRNSATGETFRMFPTELGELLKGQQFHGLWQRMYRGGRKGARFLGTI